MKARKKSKPGEPSKGSKLAAKNRARANRMADAERLRLRLHSREAIRGRELTHPELMNFIDATAGVTDPKRLADPERQFAEGIRGRRMGGIRPQNRPWLSRPIKGQSAWDPWFARKLWICRSRCDQRGIPETGQQERRRRNGSVQATGSFPNRGDPWPDPKHSTCFELMAEGPAEAVIRDHHSA
jgi:hypothetical protein